MAQIKGVVVKTAHAIMTPLEEIEDKSEWPDHIFRQAFFAHSALNEDLKTGLAIIENFAKHRAWEYIGQTRESFFDHQVHVDPANIPAILEGYKVLVGRGEHPTHWRQAVEAVRPLEKHGGQRINNKGLGRRRGTEYLIGRLKRDYPEIAAWPIFMSFARTWASRTLKYPRRRAANRPRARGRRTGFPVPGN
jgi:hypothetical protein